MITKLPFSLKYETGLDYPITMYDHLPYQRDSDYCNAEKIGLSTGKIIKYYLCNNETEPLTINNHDDEFDELFEVLELDEPEVPDELYDEFELLLFEFDEFDEFDELDDLDELEVFDELEDIPLDEELPLSLVAFLGLSVVILSAG